MTSTVLLPLPDGWLATTPERARRLREELDRELTPRHPLHGARIELVAACGDDVLLRHADAADRYTVVHLTWRGRPEPDPRWPQIVFDGTLGAFRTRFDEATEG